MQWSHKFNYQSVKCEIHYLVHLKSTPTIWRPLDFSQTCQKHGRLELLIKYQMIQHFCSAGRNSGEQTFTGLRLYGQCEHLYDRYWSTQIVGVWLIVIQLPQMQLVPILFFSMALIFLTTGWSWYCWWWQMVTKRLIWWQNGFHDKLGHDKNGSDDEMDPMMSWAMLGMDLPVSSCSSTTPALRARGEQDETFSISSKHQPSFPL